MAFTIFYTAKLGPSAPFARIPITGIITPITEPNDTKIAYDAATYLDY